MLSILFNFHNISETLVFFRYVGQFNIQYTNAMKKCKKLSFYVNTKIKVTANLHLEKESLHFEKVSFLWLSKMR